MSDSLLELLKRASEVEMTPAQREQQRQSFAYGNTKFENDRITRATIDRAAKDLEAETNTKV